MAKGSYSRQGHSLINRDNSRILLAKQWGCMRTEPRPISLRRSPFVMGLSAPVRRREKELKCPIGLSYKNPDIYPSLG